MGKKNISSKRPAEWVARGFGSTNTQTESAPVADFNQPKDNFPCQSTQHFSQKRPKNVKEEFTAADITQPLTNNPKPKQKLKILSKAKQPETSAEVELDPEVAATEDANSEKQAEGSVQSQKRKKAKQRSYTLFIGNLSFEVTREDVFAHFHKCGYIKEVRLPLSKEDNSPRGFAYLEVEDSDTYEKVLSLHHSFLKKRRINVECTFGGSKSSNKRKALIKEKTLKLRFLSREGKLNSAKQRQWGKPKEKK